MRISRALALAGIDSRRKCEVHVRNGAVTVNGEVVRDLGRQVSLEEDMISFRGRLLLFEKHVYYLFFKPEGYMTTTRDPHAQKTVYELLPKNLIRGSRQPRSGRSRVFPAGRLDKDSSGLLLFTNDGDTANKLTHPRYRIPKWYEVRLDRPFEPVHQTQLLKGIRLSDGFAKAEALNGLSRRVLRIMIMEGRKREIRRMFETIGYEVVKLCRVSQGPLSLGNLLPGQGRYLSKQEILQLKAL